MNLRRLLHRLRHPKGRYSYRCYECGHRIYDDGPDDYLGQAIREPEFGFPNVLSALYALTPAEIPLLQDIRFTNDFALKNGESVTFEWGADIQ